MFILDKTQCTIRPYSSGLGLSVTVSLLWLIILCVLSHQVLDQNKKVVHGPSERYCSGSPQGTMSYVGSGRVNMLVGCCVMQHRMANHLCGAVKRFMQVTHVFQ